jgi:hypothetical protein
MSYGENLEKVFQYSIRLRAESVSCSALYDSSITFLELTNGASRSMMLPLWTTSRGGSKEEREFEWI